MSTLIQKKSNVQSTSARLPKYSYTGLNESGRVCLKCGDKTLLINGAVYASTTPVAGRTKFVLVSVNATPGYQRKPEHKQFTAGTATGEIYRIIGTVERTLTPATLIQNKDVHSIFSSNANLSDDSAVASTSAPRDPAPALSKPEQPKPADTNRQSKLARLHKEFERVNAQRANGIDPAVRMAFAAHYLGESESNLYRRRNKGQFPKSIQRGKGTFWLMSVLDALKSGTWKPDTA